MLLRKSIRTDLIFIIIRVAIYSDFYPQVSLTVYKKSGERTPRNNNNHKNNSQNEENSKTTRPRETKYKQKWKSVQLSLPNYTTQNGTKFNVLKKSY